MSSDKQHKENMDMLNGIIGELKSINGKLWDIRELLKELKHLLRA